MPRLTHDALTQLLQRKGYSLGGGGETAKLEQPSWDGALGEGEGKKGHPERFLVRVTSFRRRLLDEDNLCEKYHVDCCRYAGLIPSDAPGKAKIEVAQVKVRMKEREYTLIEITNL